MAILNIIKTVTNRGGGASKIALPEDEIRLITNHATVTKKNKKNPDKCKFGKAQPVTVTTLVSSLRGELADPNPNDSGLGQYMAYSIGGNMLQLVLAPFGPVHRLGEVEGEYEDSQWKKFSRSGESNWKNLTSNELAEILFGAILTATGTQPEDMRNKSLVGKVSQRKHDKDAGLDYWEVDLSKLRVL